MLGYSIQLGLRKAEKWSRVIMAKDQGNILWRVLLNLRNQVEKLKFILVSKGAP